MGSGKGKSRRAQALIPAATLAAISQEGSVRCKDGKYTPRRRPSDAYLPLKGLRVTVPVGVPIRSDNPRKTKWQLTTTQRTMEVEDVSNGDKNCSLPGDPMVWGHDEKNYWCYIPADLVIAPSDMEPLPPEKPSATRAPAASRPEPEVLSF